MLNDLRIVTRFPDDAPLKMTIGTFKNFLKSYTLALGKAFERVTPEPQIDLEIVIADDLLKINSCKSGTNKIHVPEKQKLWTPGAG